MLTFHKIVELYGLNPATIKLVRHSNKELLIRETFLTRPDKFEAYQSFQGPKQFGGASHIAAFAPGHATTALFLGIWEIKAYRNHDQLTKALHALIDHYDFPASWHEKSAWYDLAPLAVMSDLSERLVIEWGPGTLAWVQAKDKDVVEIKGPNSIGDFESYDAVQLDYVDLKKLIKDANSNASWVSALSAVNGIYLIRDKQSGKHYVGAAYGERGIFGRWAAYAMNGHGGNTELIPLNAEHLEFSILEIAAPTLSIEEVLRRENRWKQRLGTRQSGFNLN